MPYVDRFSVSLDTELLAAFDRHIASRGYENRSEAVRDMIRNLLTAARRVDGEESVGAILTVVCDHRVGECAARLRTCLATHADIVAGSLHVTIDRNRDALAIALSGSAKNVQALANKVQALRGISDGSLTVIPTPD